MRTIDGFCPVAVNLLLHYYSSYKSPPDHPHNKTWTKKFARLGLIEFNSKENAFRTTPLGNAFAQEILSTEVPEFVTVIRGKSKTYNEKGFEE